MPTYSYRCTKCEKTFDVFHSMMCKDSQFCPECGEDATKLLSASSVIFKGSGFYSTDYRDSGYLEAKKKDGNSDASKPAESKPDASAAPTGTETSAPAKKAETPASSSTPSTPASSATPAKASPTPQPA
ncbi:MAG: hypothetical protein KKB51_13030 [Candidatus Riflebacteria bacterium]|nr:hypothetical protein [Candidatus Riflebacteria bacterium]